jgi:hypothetical protein
MKRATAITFACAAACGGDPTALPIEQLRDPNTCKDCHLEHYTQWSGSMHAYASDDPVFIAMNNRGQRETNGALGDFCIRCHAPMAIELGLADGQNFDPEQLPPEARGITCYYCHNVAAVEGTHNNPLVLANDQTMRGGLKNPVENPAHFSKYDLLMDSSNNKSEMCGACHDIVVPAHVNGVADIAVERTYSEWRETFYARETDPLIDLTCGDCHMVSKTAVVADAPGLPVVARPQGFHDHHFAGIDTALTPFPQTAEQLVAIHEILDGSARIIGPFNSITQSQFGGICLDPDSRLRIRVDNVGSGHAWPSGAAMDRRAWLEVRAFDVDGTVVFERGVTPADQDPLDTPGIVNPPTFGLWDRVFKEDGSPAHFFWEVASIESQLLPNPVERNGDHSITVTWDVANPGEIDRIEARLLIRALPFELIDELVTSGDLDPAIRERLPTLQVGQPSVWTRATAGTGPARNTRCNPR